MAGPYYVWSGATGGATGADWTNAFTTIQAGVAAASAGEHVYVHTGASNTHSETVCTSSNHTWSGPSSTVNGPIKIIGLDKDNSDAYTPSSSANVTIGGAYYLYFDGDFAIYGLYITHTSNGWLAPPTDFDEALYMQDCTITYTSGGPTHLIYVYSATGVFRFKGCTFDRGSDDCDITFNVANLEFIDCSFSGSNSSSFFYLYGGTSAYFIGCDFSGITTTTSLFLLAGAAVVRLIGCELSASAGIAEVSSPARGTYYLYESDTSSGNNSLRNEVLSPLNSGSCDIDTGTYRTGGATYDGTNEYSYVINNGDADVTHIPIYSNWNTGFLSSTGSTTFTVYIANATADYDDTEVWLEVEYFGSASTTLKTIATDGETDPTVAIGSGTNQTDDTSSTWSPSKTYMQTLSVTATVARAGSYRWRVGSRVTTDIYIDPKIEIS